MALKGIKIRVKGRVQGVFFRSNAMDEALKLKLTGWVRNEPNSNVLIVAEGDEDNLLLFLEWCRRGPDLSRVDETIFEWNDHTGDFHSFEIRH